MFTTLIGWFLALSAADDRAPRADPRPEPSFSRLTTEFLPPGLVGVGPPAGPLDKDNDKDTSGIDALNRAFQEAYNEGDAEAVASLFLENGEAVNAQGFSVRGRTQIAEHFRRAFEASPGETIILEREELTFLTPDLALETGRATTRPKGGGDGETSRYRASLAKVDGQWLQASVQEYPSAEPTAHERLEELDWLLGEWVDESEDAVVETVCGWSPDGSFLIREFSIHVGGQHLISGTQRIGWDPLSKTLHSWVFDPDGGHSEGWWTRVGDREWRIQARGVLADGSEVSASYRVASDHKDRIHWRSYDRSLGGEALPDLPEVLLVRKPPAPSSVEPSDH